MGKYLVYDKIDELLRERGMSRRQLAKQAGITTSNMSTLFMRKPVPLKEKYITAIADALGVDRSVFNKDVLEAEYTEREREEYALALETQRTDILFKQVNKESRNKRIFQPCAALRDVMNKIDALDERDVRALEQWLAARRIYKDFLTAFEGQEAENGSEQEGKV